MAKGKAQDLFRSKAPWIAVLLLRDFPIGVDDAAAILGNLGHESGGFASLQEIKPTVLGSKGGYGWAQWTGPRRRAYEAWCKREGLDPASDEANYRYLVLELRGPEKKAIPAVTAAKGLSNKVKAFELAFERAGASTKHYPSCKRWAAIAIEAHADNPNPALPAWSMPPATEPAQPPAPAETAIVEKPVLKDPEDLGKPLPKSKTSGPRSWCCSGRWRRPSPGSIGASRLSSSASLQGS